MNLLRSVLCFGLSFFSLVSFGARNCVKDIHYVPNQVLYSDLEEICEWEKVILLEDMTPLPKELPTPYDVIKISPDGRLTLYAPPNNLTIKAEQAIGLFDGWEVWKFDKFPYLHVPTKEVFKQGVALLASGILLRREGQGSLVLRPEGELAGLYGLCTPFFQGMEIKHEGLKFVVTRLFSKDWHHQRCGENLWLEIEQATSENTMLVKATQVTYANNQKMKLTPDEGHYINVFMSREDTAYLSLPPGKTVRLFTDPIYYPVVEEKKGGSWITVNSKIFTNESETKDMALRFNAGWFYFSVSDE